MQQNTKGIIAGVSLQRLVSNQPIRNDENNVVPKPDAGLQQIQCCCDKAPDCNCQ